ncbi:pheromone A receptor-domain-containing protein [Mycena epipterygia]|nr:pheromone A receptor-domain-containing protein [Mycena epipterygia]
MYRITLNKSRPGTRSELGMCFGIPFITMAFHIVVQGHRFDIIEDFGCQPAIYTSIPSVIILDLPPLITATLTIVYCSLALAHFSRQSQTFGRLVEDSHTPGLRKSRYFRLIFLTFLPGVWIVLALCLTKSSAYREGLQPWTTWNYVHADFLYIGQYVFVDSSVDKLRLSVDELRLFYVPSLAVLISSFFVFAFFVLGADPVEIMGNCRRCKRWLETIWRDDKGSMEGALARSDAAVAPIDANIWAHTGPFCNHVRAFDLNVNRIIE